MMKLTRRGIGKGLGAATLGAMIGGGSGTAGATPLPAAGTAAGNLAFPKDLLHLLPPDGFVSY